MNLIRYQYPNTTNSNSLENLFNFGTTSTIRRFGKLFDEFLGSGIYADQPLVDLYEDDKSFYAHFELPGVDKNQINLELENAVLTCSGSHSKGSKDGTANYNFKRSILIPDEAAQDNVSANFKNGVLVVTIPKKEAAEARRIKVK